MEFLAVLLPFLFFAVYFLKKLRIPTILGYIGVGIALAYFFPFILNSEELKELFFFKQLAIAILFFFIGLEFPYKQIIESLKSYKLAIIDFTINFIAVFSLSLIFLPVKLALLLALVLYPSSTSIIARLLMEYRRLTNKESPYLLNILILEDFVSILALIFLAPIINGSSVNLNTFISLIMKLLIITIFFYLIRKYLLKYLKILFLDAQKEDYFVLFLIGTLLFLNLVMEKIGIIEYLGAFLFGSLIAELRKENIVSKYLIPFKEFSLSIFFFLFGLDLNISSIKIEFVVPIILISIAALISKFLSTYLALKDLIDKKSALRGSFSFLPRGEFSIILASLDKAIQPIALPVIILTIISGITSFLISDKIIERIKILKIKIENKEG